MMEILAQIYVHPLFTISSITYKLWCTLQLRGQADTLPLFLLYPSTYSVFYNTGHPCYARNYIKMTSP
jgi:hypothetical protein